ncbi:MAG TPA: FtsX-like permease family protein [Thermoanaerobaculia bacterium]|nr:FtsX-like permease family protein [Thermoanaerobaculia bacterium]
MSRLLARSGRRYLARHPWASGLAVLGVALGVAVYVAISLANGSARRAFDLSISAVTGRATHQLAAGSEGFPEGELVRLRRLFPSLPMAPLIEARVTSPTAPGRVLLLLGVDPLAEAPFRPFLAPGQASARDAGLDFAAFLTRPGAALLAADTAAELGLAAGEALPLGRDAGSAELTLVGTLAPTDAASRAALADLVVVDLATAQESLDRLGRLSRIDLLLPPGEAGAEAAARLAAALPPGLSLTPAAARAASLDEMTRAFRLNLTALSLLALLCGAFLIANTLLFTVVERREVFGALRALGVTRGELLRQVLAEAALIGGVGSLLGLLLGTAASRALVGLVARTVNDLYFALSVREVNLDPLVLTVGLALGLGTTLVAALPPALEATNTPPRAVMLRSLLEEKSRRAVAWAARLGAGGICLGAALFALPSKSLLLAFGAFFVLLLGCASLAPAATAAASRLLAAPAGRLFGVLGRIAVRGVETALSRTGAAIAALTMAVAMTVAVGIMIQSFRSTLIRWLEAVLVADLYVSSGQPGSADGGGRVTAATLGAVALLPGIDRVNTILVARTEVAGETAILHAVDLDRRGFRAFPFAAGDPSRIEADFQAGRAVLLSEPYAWRRGLGPGDELEIQSPTGLLRLPVAGVIYDYGSSQGAVILARPLFDRHWPTRGATALGLFLTPGADTDAVTRGVRAAAAGAGQALEVRPNRWIKESSLVIFDRTFRVTAVLRLLAGAVAFLGVLQALLALELERGREVAVLRAEGLTPKQVRWLVLGQTGFLGGVAGLLALPVGVLMAWIMVAVINRRSFGWTLALEVPPAALVQGVALALAAALAAGLYPAWRMARTRPAEALRGE